jgi:hypothetical protein
VSIISLMVSASEAISPSRHRELALQVALATAVTTLAMPRTWPVRIFAIMLTCR